MKMENKEKKTYSFHEDRILEEAAICSIVPARVSSSSSHGPGSSMPTSEISEAAFVDEPVTKRKTLIEETRKEKEIEEGNQEKIDEEEEIEKETAKSEGTSTISRAIDNSLDSTMDVDELRGSKRKKPEGLSSEDSDEDDVVFKGARKQRILLSEDIKSSNEDEIQNIDHNEMENFPEEVDARILEMSKGYISRQKALEIEDAKEMIEAEKREENRRRKEDRKKAEKLKEKEEKRSIAEVNTLELLGKGKLIEEDYIENMTAPNVASAALNYLEQMDVIRLNCKTMQGSLSRKLREMNESLAKIVRVLLAKAEEKGDPLFLKRKIEELIKKHRKEEENRMKEVKKLSKIVTNLSKENKEMRREMERIRVSLEKKRASDPMEDSHLEKKKRQAALNKDEEEYRNVTGNTHQLGRSADRRPTMASSEEGRGRSNDVPRRSNDVPRRPVLGDGPVNRPPLQDRSVAIPGSDLKQIDKFYRKKINKVKDKIEEENRIKEERTRTGIRIKENIQIKPPRNQGKNEEEEEVGIEDREMDWEENGTGWAEEVEKEKKEEDNSKDQDMEEEEKDSTTKTEQREQEQEWIEVSRSRGRGVIKQKKKDIVIAKTTANTNNTATSPRNGTANKSGNVIKEVKRKMPKTAAVSIKGDTKQGFSYAEALRKARAKIKMEELDIAAPRIRKALNGATIIEISGPDCGEKAKKLAEKLQEALIDEKAAISTPTIKGELRIVGLDESIEKEEIRWAIEEEGSCESKDIRIGDIKRTRRGTGIVWVQCPLKAAIAIAKKKKIKVGWTVVRATLLKARPLQCFRCWQYGHVKDQCRS